jgi:glucose dehydrogenase
MGFKTFQSKLFIFSGLIVSLMACNQEMKTIDPLDNLTDWGIYRGDKKGVQYSELDQINKDNVKELSIAWEYHHGKAEGPSMYSNSIIIDGLLYFTSPTLDAICVNAVTGKEVWRFVSANFNENKEVRKGRNRGLVYHKSKESERIFLFAKNRIYAMDAKTGTHITSFGKNGYVDLNYDLDIDPEKASVEATSPGIIYKDHLIVAGRVPEGYNSTPGDIRSYNAITGEFEWIFHTIPQEDEEGFDTWTFLPDEIYGGANPWGGFTLDQERGWVFCSTGSPAPDFIYGGTRKGANLYGNCVLALNANTGEKIWHYQNIHHDIFDYDNPPAPILATISNEGEKIDVAVQFTKMGLTYILDRETGLPIFPVNEVQVGVTTIADEESSPTQPIPVLPKPLVRTHFTENEITNISPEAHDYVLDIFRKYDTGPLYTPATEKGMITTPGHQGGIEWGGGAFNPSTNIVFVNANEAPTINRLVKYYDFESDDLSPALKGKLLYNKNCTSCHGIDRKGVPPNIPSLEKINLGNEEIGKVLASGRGNMPSFNYFTEVERENLTAFLKTDLADLDNSTESGVVRYSSNAPFLVDEEGYPGIKPPWGTLNALNVATGELLWKIPFGEYPELTKRGIKDTGSKNFGGPIATAGGLVFIAATPDEKIRAFDQTNGQLMWEYKLPAAAYATPSTYMIDGKQYLVIVCGGGGKLNSPYGDSIIAFALN